MIVAGLVLDLDDTLLDTSGLLVPAADARAVRAMRGAGLSIDAQTARASLARLRSEGVADAFEELARRHSATPECGRIGSDAFLRFEVPSLELDPAVAGALDVLAARAPLVLLTAGDEDTQRTKVDRLGIRRRFEECIYVRHGEKERALRELLRRTGWPASGVVVVGDRATSEIRAGNRVGCPTVLVRRPGGEHADHEPRGDDIPWRSIASITELPALLAESPSDRQHPYET